MTVPTIQFEARLKALAATSTKDGNWTKVEFQVHPDDDLSGMLKAGINSRWQVVVVQLGDDEQPVTPEKPKGGPVSQRAGMLCADPRFEVWLGKDHLEAIDSNGAAWLRKWCHIESRAELDHNPEARAKFEEVETEFKQAHGMMPERRG